MTNLVIETLVCSLGLFLLCLFIYLLYSSLRFVF
jgi:hypothetical protein